MKALKNKLIPLLVCVILMTVAMILPVSASSEQIQTDSDTYITDDTAKESTPEESENVFAELYDKIKAYAAEILCGLTFMGSLILAYAYKRGLKPVLEKGIGAIGSAIGLLKEKTESSEIIGRDAAESISSRLSDAEESLRSITRYLDELNQSLLPIRDENKTIETTKKVLSSEVDLLYEIFMSSSLPHYQKENVSSKILQMREELKDGKKTES